MTALTNIPQPLFAPAARALLGGCFRLLSGIGVLGADNVPADGPVLVCPNHLSDCDPAAVYVACPRRDIYFVAKEELFAIPIIGGLLSAFGGICIRRDSADRGAIRHIEQILSRGAVVVMFPEGRLSETGCLGPIQPGAAMISLRTGAPIVPVGLARTDIVLPYGHIIPGRSRLPVRVVFTAPLIPRSDLKGRRRIDALTADLEGALRKATRQDSADV